MSYEISGKILVVFDTTQRTESFKTREFVIEKSDDVGGRIISNYIKFQCVQDRTGIVDNVKPGDDVKVHFNIKGAKWEKEGKTSYFNNLDAWRIETFVQAPATDKPEFNPYISQAPESNDFPQDDLPF